MSTAEMTAQSGQSRGVTRRLFPPQIDNVFRGHRLAPWLFGFYALIRLVQGAMSALNTYATATGPDGIPVDAYSPAAAQTVLALFATLGLNVMILPLLDLIALVRYRAMIPLLCLVTLIFNLSQRALQLLHPVARIGDVQPVGFYVNLVLLAVLVTAFILSLTNRPRP